MLSLVVNALASHGTEHKEWSSIYSPSISVTDINVQNTNQAPQPALALLECSTGSCWGLLGRAVLGAGFTKFFHSVWRAESAWAAPRDGDPHSRATSGWLSVIPGQTLLSQRVN